MQHLAGKFVNRDGRPAPCEHHLVTFDSRLFAFKRATYGERTSDIGVLNVDGEGWSPPLHVDLAVV